MPSFLLSKVVVWAGAYLFLIFVAICLAAGLYYVAELVEEYTRLTKKIIRFMIQAICAIHIALLVVDRLPPLCIAIGLLSHGFYFRLLKTFPYTELTSVDFLLSILMFAVSHVVWLKLFFAKLRFTLEFLLGFFLVMVWLVPFAFFISLSANDSVLPGGGGGPLLGPAGYPSRGEEKMGGGKKKGARGLFLWFMHFLRQKRDEALPEFTTAANALAHTSHRD